MGVFYLETIICAPVLSWCAYKIYFSCFSDPEQRDVAGLGNDIHGRFGIG